MSTESAVTESPQVRVARVVAYGAGTVAFMALVAFGFMLIFPERIGRAFVERSDFPAPAVIRDETAQRLALEAKARATLEGHSGRMAIAAAMDAVVARGTQAFDPVSEP